MTLSKAQSHAEQAAINYAEDSAFNQRVMEKWLQGYSLSSIAVSEGGCTITKLTKTLNIKREELKASQEATLDLLAAERIGGLRQIQQEVHEYLQVMPQKAPQLLSVALKAEETVAKIQGVLSDKVLHLGRIQHEIKLYDFTDNTPQMLDNPNIIDSTSIIIEEDELPPLQENLPVDTSTLKEVIIPPVKVVKPLVIQVTRGGYIDIA